MKINNLYSLYKIYLKSLKKTLIFNSFQVYNFKK